MKLRNIVILFLIAIVSVASADWKMVSDRDGMKTEVTVPDHSLKTIEILGQKCTFIYIPRCSFYMEQTGYPLVPKMTQLVQTDRCSHVKIEVVSKVEEEIALEYPIVPSRGHFTRNIDPETVPYEFGPVYKEDAYWPYEKEQFQAGEPFEFREISGVRLQVFPVRVNHVQMKAKVLKSAVLSIVCENAECFQIAIAPGKTFSKMYSENFLNFQATEVRGTVPDPNNKKLVVVVPVEFEGLIGSWVNWKRQSGHAVTVYSVPSGVTASTIKTYLQGLYDNVATRFSYVVLIGDAAYNTNFEMSQPMPTFKGSKEGAAADRVYVRLAGADNYPDAFISRISGNSSEITAQLNKIMAYEQNASGSWLNKGICIASNQGSPTDQERAEWLQNGGGASQKVPIDAGGLKGYGYTYFDGIYDPYCSASDVSAAVNNGRSIICYIGHGSSTSWGTTGFNTSGVAALTNERMLPVIWSVACVNGDFVKTANCFAEAWLRKANGGAVAMEAASTNESWVPPCDKQAQTVNSIIQGTYFTFGALEAAGCIKALEVWSDINSSEGNKLAEQCNLFGDCTLMVRTKGALALNVAPAFGLDNNILFNVSAQDRGFANATVTIYTEDFSFSVSGETDEAGNISLPLTNFPTNVDLYYTIVGPDALPVVNQILK